MQAGALADPAQGEVDRHARDNGDHCLGQQDERHLPQIDLLGNEQGKHLVGRGQEHRHERAERDDPPCVERGAHGGEAALGHDTRDGAHHGAGRAGALDGRADLVSRRELEDREQGEGDEQERHERQRVLGGVDHDIQNKFHGGTTFLSKDGCEGFLPMKQAVNLP